MIDDNTISEIKLKKCKHKKFIIPLIILFLFLSASGVVIYQYNYWYNYEKGLRIKRDQTIQDRDSKISLLGREITNLESNLQNTKEELPETKIRLTSTENKLRYTERDLEITETKLSDTEFDLEKTNYNLQNTQNTLQTTQTELTSANQQVAQVKVQVAEISNTIYNLESWVSDNAQLNNNLITEMNAVYKTDYITEYDGMFVIDLNIMGKMMFSDFKFQYENDATLTGGRKGDNIFDINEFWSMRKGDCEDFANFYVAWLRSIINQYGEDKVQLKPGNGYLYSNVDIYNVCGELKTGTGHCVVGIGNVYNMDSMILIEPQGGRFLGNAFEVFETLYNVISENNFYNFKDNKISSDINSALIDLKNIR